MDTVAISDTFVSLPPDCEERAYQLRGAGDPERWEVADFVAYWVDALGDRWPKASIRKALGYKMGLSSNTARSYEIVARRWEMGVRRMYGDVLTFEYFRYAPDESYLRRCVESADEYGGQPAPVGVLQAWIANETPADKPLAYYVARILALLRKALEVADGETRAELAKIAQRLNSLP